jgi:hypothetical protein
VRTIRAGDGEWIGRARIEPDGPVVAASVGEWTVRYAAGRYGVDDGGALKLSWRFASDWAEPQLEDPAGRSYVELSTDAEARLVGRYDPRGNVRPWMRTLQVRVVDGFLRPGQGITIAFRRQRAQTFAERGFRFRLFVDAFGADVYEEVEERLGFPIVSGPASRLFLTVPSQAGPDPAIRAHLRAEDAWGNPAAGHAGPVELLAPDGRTLARTELVGGVGRVELRLSEGGVVVLRARDEAGLSAESNPVLSEPPDPALRPFWGDLHGQSGETIGTGTVEEYFAYARDAAGLDFCAHQGNDFQVTAGVWEEIRRQTRAFHAPGRFVTFLGVEWSGITAAGGDRNVLYPGDDGPLHRSSHWQVEDRSDAASDAYPVAELFRAFAGQDVLLVPHVGGRRADLRWHDPELERLIELHSCWGTFEWMLDEALARGYRVGLTAGSDDHKSRPGAAGPGAGAFAVRGGLTCLWASELTRAGLWEAMRARRSSCTTGPRIVARLTADGHWMGEEYRARGAPRLEGLVVGTDELEEVVLRRGAEAVYVHRPGPFVPGERVRLAWSGARILDRNRQQRWDGRLTVEGGRIVAARPYAFDHPDEGIVGWDAGGVAWRSRTAGDEDGVELTLEDARRGVLRFESPPLSFELPLAELERERVYPAGGVGRRVVVRRLSEAPGPRVARFAWRDEAIAPGCNPYFLRVRQRDGALAWTSPIYVERGGG